MYGAEAVPFALSWLGLGDGALGKLVRAPVAHGPGGARAAGAARHRRAGRRRRGGAGRDAGGGRGRGLAVGLTAGRLCVASPGAASGSILSVLMHGVMNKTAIHTHLILQCFRFHIHRILFQIVALW